MIKAPIFVVALTAMICCGQLFAQAKPDSTSKAAQDPLAPVAWFAGGSWSTDVKDVDNPSHMVHVVNRPAWSENHQAIVFNVSFDGKPHYYGFYAYNPVTRQIDFYYTSSAGELTKGTATPDAAGKTLRQEFDIMHNNGTSDHLRSTIEREGDNAYWLTVFTNRDGQWTQLFRIKYERKAE